MSMLIVAASLFHGAGLTGRRHDRGAPTPASATLVGPGAALAFALALLASGFASSSVGTYAGQVVMQGFIARHDPARAAARGDDGARAHRAGDRRSTRRARWSSARSC